MLAYIIRRLFLAVPTLIGITLITFLLLNVVGDPAISQAGEKASAETILRTRKKLGLDKSKSAQYVDFLKQSVTLDLGESWSKKRPVRTLIAEGVGPSLALTVPAFFFATVISIALALFCAFYRDSIVDRTVVILAVAGMSISSLAYIIFFQYFFAYRWNLVPVFGFAALPAGMVFLVLPWMIWIVLSLGSDVRFFRTVMLEEMGQDYVRTAAAKGLPTRTVLFKHILKNALIPIITRVVIAFPFLFVGSLLLESFFGIPGLGLMSYEALTTNDFPVLKAMVVIGALLYILFSLISDVLYAVVDPRVRLR